MRVRQRGALRVQQMRAHARAPPYFVARLLHDNALVRRRKMQTASDHHPRPDIAIQRDAYDAFRGRKHAPCPDVRDAAPRFYAAAS